MTETRAELFLSTDMVDVDLRTDAWRAITRPFFETSHVDLDLKTPLEGSLRSRAFGSILIGPTTFNRQQYRRDHRIIQQGGLDQYLIQLLVAGSLMADCNGVSVSAWPGDICVFDLARPLGSRVESGSTISVILPRERVEEATRGRSLHGALLKAGLPATGLLTGIIMSLSRAAGDMTPAQILGVEEAAATLLAACLAQGGTETQEQTVLVPSLRHRMLMYIDARLADPALGPAMLTQQFGVSRANLYRMFATDGGVARLIRARRLDAAYRALIRSKGTGDSITQVAFAFGFPSSSQFQRAFTRRFSISPSHAKLEGLTPVLADQRLKFLQAGFAAYGQQIIQSRSSDGQR